MDWLNAVGHDVGVILVVGIGVVVTFTVFALVYCARA